MGNENSTPKPSCEAGWNPSVKVGLCRGARKVPKYLFRTWAVDSGGSEGLNTTSRITPNAFASTIRDGVVPAYRSVFESMTQQDFANMTVSHLLHEPVVTEFSSWSHSANFVLTYAFHLNRGHQADRAAAAGTAHISIIDTEQLPNFTVYVPHIDAHMRVSTDDFCGYDTYHWEFLVHGIIADTAAHRAVSVTELVHRGFLAQFPQYHVFDPTLWAEAGELGPDVEDLSRADLCAIAHFAAPFGAFQFPMIVACVCLRRRSKHLWWGGVFGSVGKEMLDLFEGVMGEFPDHAGAEAIMTSRREDGTYFGYEDFLQMTRLLRALEKRRQTRLGA